MISRFVCYDVLISYMMCMMLKCEVKGVRLVSSLARYLEEAAEGLGFFQFY